MADYNWDNFGEQIKNKVDHAVQNGDFSDLSQSIGNIINDTIDTVKFSVREGVQRSAGYARPWGNPYGRNAGNHTQNTAQAGGYSQRSTYYGRNGAGRNAGQAAMPALYERRPSGRAGGILMAVGGYTGVAVFGVILLVFLVLTLTGLMALAGIMVFSVLTCGSLALGIAGTRKLGLLGRYQRYIQLLKQQVYMPIRELSAKTGKSMEYVTRDLQKMIDRRMFFQAHIIDEDEHYLILSDDAYRQYIEAKTDYITRQKEARTQEMEKQQLSPECRKLVEDGQAYIDHIRRSNDRIPDAQISEKLFQMEKVVTRIFEVVRSHPEVAPELNKLMSYYLPTTKKLLDAYMELDGQPVAGAHIASTKAEIEGTLDTLNTAFEKLLDSLFEDKAWDISSDISVLNTVLAQDGLKDDGFGKQK